MSEPQTLGSCLIFKRNKRIYKTFDLIIKILSILNNIVFDKVNVLEPTGGFINPWN